jgi:homoserine dehydrogenase
MKRVPLIILGAGHVGRALVGQLLHSAALHADRDGLQLRVVAWCDSDGALVNEDGLGPEALRAASDAKAAGTPFRQTPLGYRQDDPVAIVDVAGADGCIVADVTASPNTVPALELALRRGYGVVTANKLPVAGYQEVFDRLVNGGGNGRGLGRGRFRYESTVGSAVPIIEAAQGLMRAADRVDLVRGMFSGTLGFIFTGLQAGQPFSALVREAMRRGYTEPDPRADLGGLDVARKALILARTLDRRLELTDVALESLYPAAMAELPLDAFLDHLPELDAGFAARVAEATSNGQALRYVAELSDAGVSVGPRALPIESALGRLRGNDNLAAFHTGYYPDEPLVLQGRGAGFEAAAAGVHADIVALASSGLL